MLERFVNWSNLEDESLLYNPFSIDIRDPPTSSPAKVVFRAKLFLVVVINIWKLLPILWLLVFRWKRIVIRNRRMGSGAGRGSSDQEYDPVLLHHEKFLKTRDSDLGQEFPGLRWVFQYVVSISILLIIILLAAILHTFAFVYNTSFPISVFGLGAGAILIILTRIRNFLFTAGGLGHVFIGVFFLAISNVMAILIFSWVGFRALGLSNYFTVMGAIFGILLGFYNLYRMEGQPSTLQLYDRLGVDPPKMVEEPEDRDSGSENDDKPGNED